MNTVREWDKCSECGQSIWNRKSERWTAAIHDLKVSRPRDRLTCGKKCERARKTRLQRERRARD